MLAPNTLSTQFAPAERTPAEKIKEQVEYFFNSPVFHQLADSIGNIFMIVNAQRQIVFSNQALLDTLKLKPEDLLQGVRPGEALHCVHATDMPYGCGTSEFCRTCGAVQAVLASLNGNKNNQECRITQEDGSALDLRIWATPLQISGEKFSMVSTVDISDEKRRRALERIFFHDILNTASIITGLAEMLQNASPEEEVQLKEQFQNLSHRLVEEINAQKALMAAENNELTVMPYPIDSLALLREIKSSYTNQEVAKERQIVVDARSQSVTLISDYTLLRRVLVNMVKNALEATDPGKTVTLACTLDREQVVFTVHNPTFIPRQDQLQIFQRSFSTKGSGRGLGTYSMKLLTERYLQGEISFKTAATTGTTFTARYPLELA
ncbi:MAG TPA: HAMP domain-containing sensor histidine kinase [Phototrophicaceae bacterium]|nr:HAMP domain-containing sensor histidine kinase [Phototrophicaceae bacterium]